MGDVDDLQVDRRRSRTADATVGLPRQHAAASGRQQVQKGAWLSSRKGTSGTEAGGGGEGLRGGMPAMSMSMRQLPLPPSAVKLGIRPADQRAS